jgi:predicted transcriptional regulator of viral defense system
VDRILKYYNRIIDNLSNQELIRTSELNGLSIYSKEISELVESGYIERVKQGYYRIVEHTEDHSEAKLISQLYPDGIICMVSALFYYGYSDRTPINWDIAIDRNVSKARFNIDYPYVKPYYIDKAHLEYGVTEGQYEDCVLKIFDRDRLICECIKHENKMDREIYNKAIINYINDPGKNVTNLLDYAKKRNIHKKVRERIGVWL